MSLLLTQIGAPAAPTVALTAPAFYRPAPLGASRSSVFAVFPTIAAAAEMWVPAHPARRVVPAAARVTQVAFPFTAPQWAPPVPTPPTPAAAPGASRSRVVLVGADTPAIAADLPPWMVAQDVAARVARAAGRTPDSRFFLATPPPDAPPPFTGNITQGYRVAPSPLDDEDALALILALTT